MKKFILSAAMLAGMVIFNPVTAQDNKDKIKDKKKDKHSSTKQIIIRKDGDEETKLTIETKDGEVFINGKPASEYKGNDVVISNGDHFVWNGSDHKFNMAPLRNYLFNGDSASKKAFLGVTTEKKDNKLVVTDVTEGSAAEKAGIKEGDVISKVGDKVVNSPEELSNAITAYKPKDQVKIGYSRDGKSGEANATLGEKSWYRSFSFDGAGQNWDGPGKLKELEHLKDLKGLNDMHVFGAPGADGVYKFNQNFGARPKLGIKIQDTEDNSGVKVMDVESGSAAEKAGIKKDDILTEIGGKKVTNTDDARTELADSKDKASWNVKVKRAGSEMSFEVKPVKKLKTTNL